MNRDTEQFYRQDFSAEQALLGSLRSSLCAPRQPLVIPDGLKFSFDPAISIIFITLFQSGSGHIRWGSKKETLAASLKQVVQKLTTHKEFHRFTVSDSSRCRILLEIVTEEYPCDSKKLSTIHLHENRLEPGIHGLKFTCGGKLYYYMPTDAIINSLMTVKQVFNFLAKRTGVARKSTSISERTSMMRSRITDYKRIQSFACISYGDKALPLYRGYPVPVGINEEIIRECIIRSTDWILDNMKPNGKFLYYYDPVKDSEVDFQHPKMTNPPYYNILRHSGGTITLLRAYELIGNRAYLAGAHKSIDFFLTILREHEYLGHYACYPYFNRKSKLGGAGIGLVSLIHFYRLSGEDLHRKYIDGLVYHILSRVSNTGELIGYFIHPSFCAGKEIIDPDEETKKELFSFYYPGEALLGLALYLLHIPDIDPELRSLILEKSRKAMDFLIHERPKKYHYLFTPLPADGWLMQAIEEWVKIEGFRDQSYIDFVYNDAQAMIDQMYQENNSPYFDYTGSFYYQYGEHAYPDGARCEGLISAYYLARHLGEVKQAQYFLDYIIKAAKNLQYTYNTPQSCYGHKYPEKSIYSFRFKLTRQWVRVDSVQHAACFYARLLPVISNKTIAESFEEKPVRHEKIDGFTVVEKIATGGFSTVYLVVDTLRDSQQYALKKLHQSAYNLTRIMREINALKIINHYQDTIKCHRARIYRGELYFLFDYAPEGDLRRYVNKNGIFAEKALFNLLRDLLNEILFARENDLLHLDISIFNVISFNNKFSLIDWGLSSIGPVARTTVIKGHRTYLAPEIYYGARTFASEIYSLGATLFYAATGKVIFDIHTKNTPFEQKMFKHLYYKPDFPANIAKKTRYLLLRMLDKNPETRATVDEIKIIISDDFIVPNNTYPHDQEIERFDLSDTFSVYKKMATDGVCHAQWQMGVYCETGEQIPRSFELAFHWFTKAADKGYAAALCSLALLFLEGKGVGRDCARAYSLLENAAHQGHGKSQYYLAMMLENGWGTKKNQEQAKYWYTESAKNSYSKAIKKLDKDGLDLFHLTAATLEFTCSPG